jgi:hypothetical protein
MTWLDKLFGATKHTSDESTPCSHASLSPMWDSVQDMGDSAKITRYRCGDCAAFLPLSAGRDQDRLAA